MKRFRKADIKFHSDQRAAVPAVNVKVYHMGASARDVAKRFGCSEDQADKALEFVFQSAQEQFWEQASDYAQEIFGAKVYSQGRCGGWLVVDGITREDAESWDAIALGKWAQLVKWCEAEIAHLTCAEAIMDAIDANQWHKDGAEAYNFVDTDKGPRCIADLKSEAKAAGFGAVVRK